ncbi:protein STRUBBELIG-RECEPTOR FAMILY 5-like isoform X1 [Nymphaea colorata]|nr:protein STRUBBELIG-RECEPTOR FAMILY 5-like isoform X1 [Nymphaea colorata]
MLFSTSFWLLPTLHAGVTWRKSRMAGKSGTLVVGDSKQCALVLGILLFLFNPVIGKTDADDVSALKVMYSSLNSAPQLTGWSSAGGDPCADSWKGIKCSGSSVTEIKLSGLGLTGTMGYQLSSLTSVTYFDLSNNNLQGSIPYQLPPNAAHINLASNSFSGSIPYSISQMSDLEYLNLAHNQLNVQLSDMFGQLQQLTFLDLSFNGLSGDLPQSFASLSRLTTLYLQNNQLTGSINVLASLPLDNLNIENNHFSGWIPSELKNINNIKTGGNSWSSGPAPPSPHQRNKSNGHSKSGMGSEKIRDAVIIIGLAIGAFALIGIAAAIVSSRSSPRYLDEEKMSSRNDSPFFSQEIKGFKPIETSVPINMKTLQTSSSIGLQPPPSEQRTSFSNSDSLNKSSSRRSGGPVMATNYPLAELQMAAGGFGREHFVGEGALGQVFKAKYVDGKEKLQVLAVKKLMIGPFEGENSGAFMETVSEISRLHHPNITELVGYCSERGQNLLVYEFLQNGSLHDFLHLSDDFSKPLTWNTRVKIALGTARAIEYLHEVCSPSVIHRDIKSANILLDAELNPRLSDCGFAAFYQDLNKNLGVGYIPPECTTPSAYTLKSDVYSFGVVMLELVTGRKPFDSSKSRLEQSLARWAAPQLHDIDALAKMVDPALRGLYPAKALSQFADVIAICVQPEPEFRPPMSEVVQALLRLVQRGSMNTRPSVDGRSTSCRTSDADHSDYRYI